MSIKKNLNPKSGLKVQSKERSLRESLSQKKRLDILLVDKKLTKSRKIASDLIKDGKVFVDGKKVDKPSREFSDESKIEITEMPKYVSRAGLKLEGALKDFEINLVDKVVIDVGASTGGFTDFLLQNGVKRVYAIDVGTDQLSHKLKSDIRVVSLEKTDIRNVTELPEKADLAVVDVSFISLEKVLPTIIKLLKSDGKIIALFKPQFEVGRENLGKGGIVKDEEAKISALKKLEIFASSIGLYIKGKTISPILGGDGNEEFLLYLTVNNQ